jgi:acyl-CoA thioesterase-2
MIAAQAAMAAQRSAPGRLHSLHGYFMLPGRPGTPLSIEVEAMRDGRSFAQRRVRVLQRGESIFELSASFCRDDSGPHHDREDASLPVDVAATPEPESLPDWELVRPRVAGEPPRRPDAIEVRVCNPEHDQPGAAAPPQRRVWIRPRGSLPDDPAFHSAAMVYASDRSLLRTGARLHLDMSRRLPASLDHSVWLHRRPRFDDWLLFASESPIAAGGRVWVQGRMLNRRGERVATIAQEGLMPHRTGR